MKKTEFVNLLVAKTKLPKPIVQKGVDSILESISMALKNNDPVDIRGFGTFRTKSYDSYIGRNPRDGTQIEIPPKKLPTFKPHNALKNQMKGDRPDE